MALNVDSLPTDADQFNAYLAELDDEQLDKLEAGLVKRFQELSSDKDNLDDTKMERVTQLSEQIAASRVAKDSRASAAMRNKAAQTAKAHQEALAALTEAVEGKKADPKVEAPSPGMEALTSALATAMQTAVTQVTASTGTPGLNNHIRNMPLGKVQQLAPDPGLQPTRSEAVLIASADIPGRARNASVSGIGDLVDLIQARARMMGVTRNNPNYVPVAYLKREHRFRLGNDATPEEVNEVLTAATDVGALVAAGGWCAPSEISYDFFNIVCEDGMVDLPTVGVLNRGGFRFPTSPTIADIFADPDALWSWTEQQDVEALTSDSTVKTCVRVDCVDFEEVRAACDGLCVTAGNLTDFAYPEMVQNFIRLVMAGRAHRTNQLILQEMEDASTAVDMTGSNEGSTASILNSVELQAIDYRERFRMCEDAILEAVFDRWVLGAIRADLANRNGVDFLDVTNQQIAAWLDRRNVRAQFVADWNSGFVGSPIGSPSVIATEWPATTQFMLYAPGTFVRGQGLQLDLGVVRDSVLNERNDHTAAWMEDCYAIAKVGHESRLVTTDICTSGVTGAADLVCAAS